MKFYDWGTLKASSIEVTPSISYYTYNNNASDKFGIDGAAGPDSQLRQSPLFNLDAHYTRTFNKILWASIDANYSIGGETSVHPDPDNDDDRNDDTDIVNVTYNDDLINSLQLGATVGGDFFNIITAKASFGGVVYHGDNSIDGFTCKFSYI
jgi:hypothetical protein